MAKLSLSFCFIILTAFFLKTISIDALFDLILLDDPDARCLDGTPGAYYISRQGDPNKIYLSFDSGGWCGEKDLASTLESCYQRSKTNLGSSAKYPKIRIETQGSLSLDQQNNFKNWTRVLLMYCDGAGHQGTNSKPIKYKNTNLYFRGNNITIQQFNALDKKNKLFSGVKQIVVGGGSAGGLAAYLWTNYIVDRAKNAKVWTVSDSGIFLDSINKNTKLPSYKIGFENLMKLSNVEIDPPVPQCIQNYKNTKQNCMLVQNFYMYLRAPVFHIQSLYDIWSIPNILGINCIQGLSLANCDQNDRAYIEQYHKNTTNLLFLMGKNDSTGFWAPSCAYHGFIIHTAYYNSNFRIPMGSQYSASESVLQWLAENQQKQQHIDLQEWPANKPCSGIKNNILTEKLYPQKDQSLYLK